MKTPTEEIIKDLRAHTMSAMREAADRLEELQRDLKQAIAERAPHDYGLLKQEAKYAMELNQELKMELNHALAELHQARGNARPESSRLEIAAMLKAGGFANRDADFNATDHKWWIEQADALIAAAKEAK